MYNRRTIYKHFTKNISIFQLLKKENSGGANRRCGNLLLAEGLAVGALIHGRVLLMGTNHDPIQGAVVLAVAVISALLNSAFNAFISLAVHIVSSFLWIRN